MLQLRNNVFYRIVGFVLATVVLLAPTIAQGAPDTNITGTIVAQAESFQQTDTDANIQGTQCANYDMGIGYWHPVRVLWFTMNVPVSDEIRIRYRACWNDSLVWQDSGPIQIVNSAGSTVYQPGAETSDSRFGNGADPTVNDSGVTLLFQPRVNASYNGFGINTSVSVTTEIEVYKGGCARLYFNKTPVSSRNC